MKDRSIYFFLMMASLVCLDIIVGAYRGLHIEKKIDNLSKTKNVYLRDMICNDCEMTIKGDTVYLRNNNELIGWFLK